MKHSYIIKVTLKSLLMILALSFLAVPAKAERVDSAKAKNIAKLYAQSKPQFSLSGKAQLKHTVMKAHGGEQLQGTSAKSAGQDSVCYYIFNVNENDNAGFVIVAGNDIARPILGFSDNGNYDENNLPPNFAAFIKGLRDEITFAVENKLPQSSAVKAEWEKIEASAAVQTVIAGPLIRTKWNQTAPYSDLCPKKYYTGCIATAMAQIMKYYDYPVARTVAIPGYVTRTDKFTVPSITGTTTYEWSLMTNTYNSSSSTESKTAVATLMLHCGVSVEMDYAASGSGAYTSDAGAAMIKYFDYDKNMQYKMRDYYSNSEWEEMIRREIDAGKPVFYSGANSSDGHAFVCDGYDDVGKFHFNWGWGGSYDGYFVTTALNPGTGGAGAGSGTYNQEQEILINIIPNTGEPAVSVDIISYNGKFSSTKSQVKAEEEFSVSTDFLNSGLSTFEGYFGIALTNQDDKIIELTGKSSKISLQSMYGYISSPYYSITCKVSASVPAGDYNLRPVAITSSGDTVPVRLPSGKPGVLALTVIVPVQSVEVDRPSVSVGTGMTAQLKPVFTPEFPTNTNVSWSSSNTAIATVDGNGLVTGKSAGTASVTVKTEDGNKTANCAVTVVQQAVSVTGITLNKTASAINVNATEQLTASVTPANATNNAVIWSSSNTELATVSDQGLVTGKKAGTATITATTEDGNKTATCSMTVTQPVTGVTVNKTAFTLTINDTEQLTETVAPDDASNKTVSWSSDKENVATVNNGLVTGISAGTAKITVTTTDGNFTATCVVMVEQQVIPVTGVTLDQTAATININATAQLTATVAPADATNKIVTWSSSNSNIATVDENGLVTGKSYGTATITVTTTDGSFTAVGQVTVVQPVTGVSLDKTSMTVNKNSTGRLTATVSPSNATDKALSWSSDNNSIATVDDNGLVTGISAGKAKITVTTRDGDKTAICTVTVKDLPIKFIDFTLNRGSKVSLFPAVDLNFTFDEGAPTHFAVSEKADLSDASWKEYNDDALKYTFATDKVELKTVYAKLKNSSGETEAKSGSIYYKPYHAVNVESFGLNGGAAKTPVRKITLNSAVTGDPLWYSVSEDASSLGKIWLPYVPAPEYLLSAGKGLKTVYFAVSDGVDISETVSAEIYLDEMNVTLYPNPVENMLNVELASEAGNFDVKVYSIDGKLLLSRSFGVPVFVLDISSCPSGVLIVRIYDSKNNITVERTVVK